MKKFKEYLETIQTERFNEAELAAYKPYAREILREDEKRKRMEQVGKITVQRLKDPFYKAQIKFFDKNNKEKGTAVVDIASNPIKAIKAAIVEKGKLATDFVEKNVNVPALKPGLVYTLFK